LNSKFAFQVKDRQFKIKKYLQQRAEEPPEPSKTEAEPPEETLLVSHQKEPSVI